MCSNFVSHIFVITDFDFKLIELCVRCIDARQVCTFKSADRLASKFSSSLSRWWENNGGEDAFTRWCNARTAETSARNEYAGLYGLLCGVDDLFDHRHPHQTGAGPVRDPVRPAGRHAGPDRLDQPHIPWCPDGDLWRPDHVPDPDGDHCRRCLPALNGQQLSALPARRARRRSCRWILHHRDCLCLALV